MTPSRYLILIIEGDGDVDSDRIERLASQRGYIVTNPRPVTHETSITYADGTRVQPTEDAQMWIADIVITENDDRETA